MYFLFSKYLIYWKKIDILPMHNYAHVWCSAKKQDERQISSWKEARTNNSPDDLPTGEEERPVKYGEQTTGRP